MIGLHCYKCCLYRRALGFARLKQGRETSDSLYLWNQYGLYSKFRSASFLLKRREAHDFLDYSATFLHLVRVMERKRDDFSLMTSPQH
jgi:hypothetical protein